MVRELEKQAILSHLLAGGAFHMAQNAATHLALTRSGAYRSAFRDYFHAGLQGMGHPTAAASPVRKSAFSAEHIPSEMGGEAQHLGGGGLDRQSEYVTHRGGLRDRLFGAANPELKILLEEAHAAGTHAREQILKRHAEATARAGKTGNQYLDRIYPAANNAMETKITQGATLQRHAGAEHTQAAQASAQKGIADMRTSANLDMDVFGVSDANRSKVNNALDTTRRWTDIGAEKTTEVQNAVGKRSMVIYSRALRGDFTHLHDMAKRNPHLHGAIHQALQDMEVHAKYPLTHILQGRDIAERVEKEYKKNPVTGRLIASLADKPKDMSWAADNLSTRSSSMMQGAAIAGALDPVAGAMNATKLALSDKELAARNPFVKKVGDKLTDVFVKKPLENAAKEGYNQEKRHGPLYRFYNKFIMNNALGHVEDAANAMSYQVAKNRGSIRRSLSVPDDIQ